MPFTISVIIPTYNRAALIPYTLDSILGQSYPASEIIVVDDGSTDDTEDVIRRFGSSIKYLRIENSGQPCARNAGASASTGDWIAFCDSDDLWHREKLMRQVRLFESTAGLEYSFTNFRTVTKDTWSTSTKFDSLPPGFWYPSCRQVEAGLYVVQSSLFERLLLNQPIFAGSTVMMKRSFFEAVGPWEESLARTRGEDFEFSLRCVARPPIGVITEPLVGIRKHASNFSGDSLKTTLGEIEILRFVLERHAAARGHQLKIREQIVTRSINAAQSAFEIGDFATMRQLLKTVPHARRPWKLAVKSLIASCPDEMGQFLRKVSTALRAATKL